MLTLFCNTRKPYFYVIMRGESYGNICRDCRQDRSSERASGDLRKANADGLEIRGNDVVYPYVDPDKITTMFLFATSPLLSQSGNTKSSIKGNTLKEPLNKPRPRTTDLFRQSYGSKNGKYVAAVGDKGAIRMRACPLRVRKVFRHFPNLVLTKKLSPSTAADLIRASIKIRNA